MELIQKTMSSCDAVHIVLAFLDKYFPWLLRSKTALKTDTHTTQKQSSACRTADYAEPCHLGGIRSDPRAAGGQLPAVRWVCGESPVGEQGALELGELDGGPGGDAWRPALYNVSQLSDQSCGCGVAKLLARVKFSQQENRQPPTPPKKIIYLQRTEH